MSSIVLLLQMRKTISKNYQMIRIFTWSSIHTGLFPIKNGQKKTVFIAPHFTVSIQQETAIRLMIRIFQFEMLRIQNHHAHYRKYAF